MGQKITPNDLRLGNCLYYTKESKFPMQVEGIGKDWIYLNFEGNDGDVFENNGDEIYPIPISVELLSNLSKNLISDGYIIYIGSENIEFSVERKDEIINLVPCVNYDEYDIGKPIRYVHQLQNLYKELTGNELEIRREWL
jgi:hypothetical protein